MAQMKYFYELTISSSPHVHSPMTTQTIMRDVVIALVPALLGSVYFFGLRALMVTLISVAACVFFEWAYCRITKMHSKVYDLSAVITGMLLAFVCPVTIPYWCILIGDFFAIVVVKMLFGGLGRNLLNPALTAKCVLLIVAALYGYYPNLYMLQIIYYSFCLFILVLAMSYFTCAVVVFFRDLAQIINIALQVGMWATPILWNIGMIRDSRLITVVKLNPLVYIVNGYREAIYGDLWFFEHFYSSTYFWIFVVTLFCIGSLIFKRLKVHFADVL